MERNQFTFYRSFWIAMKSLPKKDRLPLIDAICAYVFDGEVRELSGGAAAAFFLISPVLNTAAKRAESGKQGGSKIQANGKPDESKNENERENKIEDECPPPSPPPGGGRPSRRRGQEGNVFAEMLREELG